jgi:hypothetical protein
LRPSSTVAVPELGPPGGLARGSRPAVAHRLGPVPHPGRTGDSDELPTGREPRRNCGRDGLEAVARTLARGSGRGREPSDIAKRFAAVSIENTEENRCLYRQRPAYRVPWMMVSISPYRRASSVPRSRPRRMSSRSRRSAASWLLPDAPGISREGSGADGSGRRPGPGFRTRARGADRGGTVRAARQRAAPPRRRPRSLGCRRGRDTARGPEPAACEHVGEDERGLEGAVQAVHVEFDRRVAVGVQAQERCGGSSDRRVVQ